MEKYKMRLAASKHKKELLNSYNWPMRILYYIGAAAIAYQYKPLSRITNEGVKTIQHRMYCREYVRRWHPIFFLGCFCLGCVYAVLGFWAGSGEWAQKSKKTAVRIY